MESAPLLKRQTTPAAESFRRYSTSACSTDLNHDSSMQVYLMYTLLRTETVQYFI